MRVFVLCLLFGVSFAQIIPIEVEPTVDSELGLLLVTSNIATSKENEGDLQGVRFSVYVTPGYVAVDDIPDLDNWQQENGETAYESVWNSPQRYLEITGRELLMPIVYAAILRNNARYFAALSEQQYGGKHLEVAGLIFLVNYRNNAGQILQLKLDLTGPTEPPAMRGIVYVSPTAEAGFTCAGEVQQGRYIVEREDCDYTLVANFFGLEP